MTDLGYRLASMLFRRLPPCASDRLLHAISDGYVFTHPRRARTVDRNLAWIWNGTGRAGAPPRARETYRAFARALRDFLAQDPGRGAPRVRLSVSRSHFNELATDGRLRDWAEAYEHGHVRVSGDSSVVKLLGNVIARQRARA